MSDLEAEMEDQSPFSPAADSVSTTARNSSRAARGSSSLRAGCQSARRSGDTLGIIVAVFHVHIGFVLLIIFINEVIVN
jgi:hypothetical protein